MSKLDKQFERIADIVAEGDPEYEKNEKCPATLAKYFSYLEKNITFPCLLTGVEDFPWEERYLFSSGFFSKRKYEKLKKTNPSCTDTFELIALGGEGEEQIIAAVKRPSDNKEFIIELDWLEATDKHSKNYQILKDYAVWFVNH